MKTNFWFIILFFVSCNTNIYSQDIPQNPFVYWENDEFKLEGETFLMKGINYAMDFHYDELSATLFYGPYRFYDFPNASYSNQQALDNVLHAHFRLIHDMGFNTVRLMMNNIGYESFTCNLGVYDGLCIGAWDKSQLYLTGQSNDTLNIGDNDTWNDYFRVSENYSSLFAAMDKIFEIANEYDLKIIWVCAAGHLENCLPEYYQYLDSITKRYVNEPALFAYDFWHEPKEYSLGDINNSYSLKMRIANITDSMNCAIKENDRNHFTTIGTDALWSEFDFGFKALNADFVNPHIYDVASFYFGAPDYATEDVLKRDIFWFHNNMQDKKWFIGEVGMPGGSGAELLVDGCYADFEEQNRVAEELLNFNFASNSVGLCWWEFHNVNWLTGKERERGIGDWADYFGVVSKTGTTNVDSLSGSCTVTNLNIYGSIKDIGSPNGAFNSFTNSTTTCTLTDNEYYNPNHIDNSSVYYGYVLNYDTNEPIEGAIVQVKKRGFLGSNLTVLRNIAFVGITNADGYFEIPTIFDDTLINQITAAYYGMTDTTHWAYYDDDDPNYSGHILRIRNINYPNPTTFASDITITTNTTWDTGEDRWLQGNVTVAAGATLTIKCNVYFLEGKGITVQTGAKLTLSGGKLSTAGNDYLWNGITLLGNASLSQALNNQGYFSMSNNAVIANANIAVKVHSGAICKVYSGSFINNRYATYFYAYTNPQSANYNASSIQLANFYVTGTLNNGTTPSYFNYLNSVKDIEFTYCNFTNTSDNTVNAKYRGKGIHATSSTIEVYDCNFNGLYYGIYCAHGTPRINSNTFENNLRSIYTGNATNVEIYNNSFNGTYYFPRPKDENIPNPPPYIYEPYSVYIAGDGVNNTVYKFEDNVIENGKIGSLFYNTGPNAVKAKGNTYSNITGSTNACAAVTIGKNSNFNGSPLTGNVGLEFRCNTFNSNAYSLSIIDGNMRKYQGEYQASQGSDYAGNAFDHVGTNLERDFYVDQVVVSSLNIPLYEYYSHNDDAHKILYFTDVKVDPYGQAFNFQETDCSSTGGGGGIVMGMSVGEGSEIIEQTDTEIMLKEYELAESIDDGNTYILLNDVETMTNDNSVIIASEIAMLDGYISDELAITYIQNSNGNQFAKANALLENSPLPSSVRDEIDNMDMNPTLKQIVKNQQNGVNKRDKKQVEIAGLIQYRGIVVNEMVNSALYNDSVPSEKQALKQFLNNDNNLQSKFHLLNLYKNESDFINANATLNEIKQSLNYINGDLAFEFDDYINLQKIMLNIASNTLTIEDAVDNNADFLTMIASSESHPGQVTAQLLLAEAGVEDYYEFILLPELPFVNKSLSVSENKVLSQNIDYGDIINVYPNPSNGTIYVEYAFVNFSSKNNIEIYSINGNLIDRIQPEQAAGLYTYNKTLAPGNYIIKVGDNFSQQITVQ